MNDADYKEQYASEYLHPDAAAAVARAATHWLRVGPDLLATLRDIACLAVQDPKSALLWQVLIAIESRARTAIAKATAK